MIIFHDRSGNVEVRVRRRANARKSDHEGAKMTTCLQTVSEKEKDRAAVTEEVNAHLAQVQLVEVFRQLPEANKRRFLDAVTEDDEVFNWLASTKNTNLKAFALILKALEAKTYLLVEHVRSYKI